MFLYSLSLVTDQRLLVNEYLSLFRNQHCETSTIFSFPVAEHTCHNAVAKQGQSAPVRGDDTHVPLPLRLAGRVVSPQHLPAQGQQRQLTLMAVETTCPHNFVTLDELTLDRKGVVISEHVYLSCMVFQGVIDQEAHALVFSESALQRYDRGRVQGLLSKCVRS